MCGRQDEAMVEDTSSARKSVDLIECEMFFFNIPYSICLKELLHIKMLWPNNQERLLKYSQTLAYCHLPNSDHLPIVSNILRGPICNFYFTNFQKWPQIWAPLVVVVQV